MKGTLIAIPVQKMKWLMLIAVLLLRPSLAEEPVIPNAEFFSEGTYWSGVSVLSNAVFARAFAPVGKSIKPFIQLGNERFFGEQGSSDLYWAPGLHWNLDFIRVFGEHRFHQKSELDSTQHEWRLLLVTGKRVDLPLSGSSQFLAFWEPYAELLFSSLKNTNLWLQGFSRVGIRYQLSDQISTDLFVEPYLSVLQNGVGDIEQFQIKPSLRATSCFETLCFTLSAAKVVIHNEKTDPGFRFLATLGGMI